jgi:hypothetical protein
MSADPKTYVNVSGCPQELGSGRVLPPGGETVPDPKHPLDRRLIDTAVLIEKES